MSNNNDAKRAPRSVVEKDFNEAIDRLIAGKPRNKKHADLVRSGKMQISFTVVSLEAERSRSLIAHKGCAYQQVRRRVLELLSGSAKSKREMPAAKMIRLQSEVKELKQRLEASLNAQVENLLAREKAEREAAKWRDAFKRLKGDRENVVHLAKP